MLIRRLLVLIAAMSMVLAACGSPAASPLTDPKDILSKSIVALQGTKSAHVHVDLSGSFKADLTGTWNSPRRSTLAGTTADLDLDIANKAVHVAAAMPALLGVTLT